MTDAWADALTALALFAVDPMGTVGIRLKAHAGPVRTRWLEQLAAILPAGVPVKKAPCGVADARLLGGLDLAATLNSGRPVAEQGLLSDVHGGVLMLAMAERLPSGTAALIASALDTGTVSIERDGLTLRTPARFGLIALDEGIGEDECPPAALIERLAFHVDLTGVSLRDSTEAGYAAPDIAAARDRVSQVAVDGSVISALCETAAALGVGSVRAELLALSAARAAAALAGLDAVGEAEACLAARLVFAARATQMPAPAETEAAPEPEDDPATSEADQPDLESDDEKAPDNLADILREAVSVHLPADLLERARAASGMSRARTEGRAGQLQASGQRGRVTGIRAGIPGAGARLNIIETLRAAAPWQKIRTAGASLLPASRIRIAASDLRVSRFTSRTRTAIIFVVDASGSQALSRLAEAKGAVELLLADCYVRRDQVAVIAFRGTGAEVLMPLTHSLTRAKRSLAGLPGGGATPLAAGIDAALILATKVRRGGETALIVCLTDGQANVGRDGRGGRPQAEADALGAARLIRAAGHPAILIDTAQRPGPRARDVANAMGADYIPLPQANAEALSRVMKEAVKI